MDAAISRSEVFHHLKTLAETYINFHWLGNKTDDKRAKLLIAVGFCGSVTGAEFNPQPPFPFFCSFLLILLRGEEGTSGPVVLPRSGPLKSPAD